MLDVSLKPYAAVLIEISGKCNAKCKWCTAGRKNFDFPLEMPSMKRKFMPFEDFKNFIGHMLAEKIADRQTLFSLYIYGEPFLHPDLAKILSFMEENELCYSLSTNVSVKFKTAERQSFRGLKTIFFSYSGFSQVSYDRIHQFDFSKIRENTMEIMETLKTGGFKGSAVMNYHVYQFNQGMEMLEAYVFCRSLGIHFSPYYAIMNDYRQTLDYVEGKLAYPILEQSSKELCLHYVQELIENRPNNYHCTHRDALHIDENGNLLECCYIRDANQGTVLNYDRERIARILAAPEACKPCISSGADILLSEGMPYVDQEAVLTKLQEMKDIYMPGKNKDCISRAVMILGAGKDGLEAYAWLKRRGARVQCFIDRDQGKIGTLLRDIPVKSYDALKDLDKSQVILISSEQYQFEMKEILLHMGLQEGKEFFLFGDFAERYIATQLSEVLTNQRNYVDHK